MTAISAQNDGRARNPKLKLMMLAIFAAIFVNAVLAAYAPLLVGCGAGCDQAAQANIAAGGGSRGLLIEIGLAFPRIAAYRHLQASGGFVYPWVALAFAYGVFVVEYLIGIAITWTVITLDCWQWSRSYDFTQPLKNMENTRRVMAAMLIVLVLTLWSLFINDLFHPDRPFGHAPRFEVNMWPAVGFSVLYMLTSFLFGMCLRLGIYYLRRRRLRAEQGDE